MREICGNRIAQAQRPRVADAMLAHQRPIRVRVVGLEGEGELWRAQVGFGRGDGRGHPARGGVDEDADGGGAVGGVGDGDAVEGAAGC